MTPQRDGTIVGVRGHPLKHKDNGNGYHIVSYRVGGKVRHKYVHRLVAEAFCPNPEGHRYVNHIDGDKDNNSADNLEWCSAKHNTAHAIENGLITNVPKKGQRGFQCTS